MKKRLTSLLLTAAMIISMIVVPTAAAGTLGLTVDAADGMPGETVNVNVDISGLGDTQLGTLQFAVAYDINSLELVGTPVAGSAVPAGAMVAGGDANKTGSVNVSVITMMGALASDGTVASMSFKIKDSVTAEELPLAASIVVAKTPISSGMTDKKSEFTITDDIIDVIYPITATTGDAEQKTVTSAVLNGTYTENVDGLTVEASGIKWGTAENALTNTAAFGAEVTGTQGATIYYQAYATVGGVEYVGEVKSIVLAGPEAKSIEISGADSIEVTFEDNTTTYTAAVKDQFGAAFETTVSWSLVDAPAGVSISDAGVVTVTKAAQSGNVTVKATAGTAEATKTVAINRPAPVVSEITIADIADVAVPTAAVGTATVELTATGVDQFAETITLDNVQWSVSAAEGVSIADNVITVTNKAAAGTVTVTATVGSVTDTFELNITKAPSVATGVAFTVDAATMTIPTDANDKVETFATVVTDQYGDEMTAEVAYTFATADEFVSADANTVTVKMGATAGTTYTLTASIGEQTDTLTITVVDIEINWDYAVSDSAVYGDTWSKIVTLGKNGSATLDGSAVKGTFEIVDKDTAPKAGEQTFTLKFTSDDGVYVVTKTDVATVARKDLTLTWNAPKSITYTGELPAITATLKGVLTGDDVTVNVQGLVADAGTYEATAELAGADKDNYTLTTASMSYTIAKAKATVTIADQTIRASKTSEQLAAQIGTIQADGVNGEKIDGVLTVTDDISGKTPSTKAQKVNVSFAHTNGNYETPVAGTVMVIFTEGDPQTIAVAPVNATYGDAAVANAATVTEGGAGTITYASNNEAVATVDAAGTVTIVGAGEATVTVTVAADGDWAETSTTYTVTVAPKAVTVSGITAADKAYDGKTDAVVDVTAAVVEGKVGQDDVTVASAKGAFADANAAAGKTVTISDIVLTGAAVNNYVLSDAAVTATASITKADVTVTLGGLKQSPDKVKDITVALTPAVEDATVKVEYYVAPVAEIPCDHVDDKLCTTDGTACPHTDECGCSYAPGVDGYWTEDITNVQAKGEYPVRVTISGSANVNDIVIENAGVLVVKKSSGGGGGGGSAPVKPPVEEEDDNFFIDVDENAWYYGAVESMLDKGLMAGVSEDKFAPDMNLTRSMVVQILWAMAGKPVVNYTMTFEDVTAGAWYTEAVRWAASEGVASGYSAEAFGPDDAVTREQLAVMLYAYARKNNVDVSVGENTNILSYNDAFSISEWAIPAMQWACGEGLISGTPAGDLLPGSVASRAQVAVILNNFSDLING